MSVIGIIGAMEVEVATLKQTMEVEREVSCASLDFAVGRLCGCKVVVVRSGVGKVNAAICAQILVDRFGVDCIINTGIAGSLNADINIGDIVLSTDALEHDMDAVAFGYPVGVIPQMDTSVFVADERLRSLARLACEAVNPDISVFEGRVVTGDQFIADKTKKNWLVSNFHGMCTEMEGAAIAHTAYNNSIPFLIIRAISDKADDSASEDYPAFEAKAVRHSVNLVTELCKYLVKM